MVHADRIEAYDAVTAPGHVDGVAHSQAPMRLWSALRFGIVAQVHAVGTPFAAIRRRSVCREPCKRGIERRGESGERMCPTRIDLAQAMHAATGSDDGDPEGAASTQQ